MHAVHSRHHLGAALAREALTTQAVRGGLRLEMRGSSEEETKADERNNTIKCDVLFGQSIVAFLIRR
jgi:hypothetical protein